MGKKIETIKIERQGFFVLAATFFSYNLIDKFLFIGEFIISQTNLQFNLIDVNNRE